MLNWLANLIGFNEETFPFPAQIRALGALSGIAYVAVTVIGVYVLFRKAFGSLEDFDGAAAGALAAVAGAGAVTFAALVIASRRN
jgi:hypothetical protein